MRSRTTLAAAVLLAACGATALFVAGARAQAAVPGQPAASWSFAVSGDSRNCGDVVMPAIAAGVQKSQARFYWHLGDLRATIDFDEDILNEANRTERPDIVEYERMAWRDFIEHQVAAFGALPFYLGIGNHETYWPKTREMFLLQFADWLEAPVLQRQRLADNPRDHMLRAYYHWVQEPVDFIYLDNATEDQFDDRQMAWLRGVLARDVANPAIRTLVVGMHEALPESISASHSMNESDTGTVSGREVYARLLEVQNKANKRVYVLASHSHFFMEGIFNTEWWRSHGGVLPGWIVGTAGAVRYALPPNAKDAKQAETNVYGYLLGTVAPDGAIGFEFRKITQAQVPPDVARRYRPNFVTWCFKENSVAEEK